MRCNKDIKAYEVLQTDTSVFDYKCLHAAVIKCNWIRCSKEGGGGLFGKHVMKEIMDHGGQNV